MGDQYIDSFRYSPPHLFQAGFVLIIGKARKIGTPGRSVNGKASNFNQAILKKLRMGELKLTALQHKIMIASNANHMRSSRFRKPGIDVFQRIQIVPLKTAKIPTVNQNIALWNRKFPMLLVSVSYDAERRHIRSA